MGAFLRVRVASVGRQVQHRIDSFFFLFFVPCSNVFLESEFEHAPGGEAFGNLSIYSYHYYTNVNLGSPDKYFNARERDYRRLGAAGFVTETSADPGILSVIESFVQSWSIWEVGCLPSVECRLGSLLLSVLTSLT